VSTSDFEKSYAAAQAMLMNQADVPPMIIHTLRVLVDPASFPPGHAKWVEDGVRAILKNWEREEDLGQLKRAIGLDLPKRRRKELTMRSETEICAAIADAALAGTANPNKAAGDKLDADERKVQRAWKRWGPVYLARLKDMESRALAEECPKIRRAIDVLEKLPGDKK